MADDVQTPAESSPAGTTVHAPIDSEAYANWRQTGEIPGAKANEATEKPKKSEDSATSRKSSEGAAAEAGVESGAASEADTDKQESRGARRSNADTRLRELLDDLKRAGLTPAELKTFKREAQRAAIDQTPAAQQSNALADGRPQAPKEPQIEDFEDYDKYQAAIRKYGEEVVDYRVDLKLFERSQREAQEAANRVVKEKFEAATKRYGEGSGKLIADSAAAIFNDQNIAPPIKAMVDDSPVIADLMYVMGSKADEFKEFLELSRTNPGKAIRKLVVIEQLVAEELAKSSTEGAGREGGGTPTRGEDGKSQPSAAAPAKKTTQAPPPPDEASGRGAAPPDALESAVKRDDFRSFRTTGNQRDLARHSGR